MKQVWFLIVVFLLIVMAGVLFQTKPKIPEGFQIEGPTGAPAHASIPTESPMASTRPPVASTPITQSPTSRPVPTCISRAYYTAMGKIVIEPHGMIFDTVAEYMNFFNAIQRENPACVLPTIQAYTGPIPGITSGGTGTPSADQVALEDARRVVTTTEGGQDINSLGDYEYNRVFLENRERNSETANQYKDAMIQQYQRDWTNLPYNSDTRATLEDQFVQQRMEAGFREPATGVFFRSIDGTNVAPPDQDAAAIREAKILSAYQPTSLTAHQVDDEMERVAKVVAQTYKNDPDWEPVVEKVAEHQYTVRELRPRHRKTEWDGDGAPTIEEAQRQGLLTGGSTQAKVLLQQTQEDPYFAKDGVADYASNRFWKYNEFNKWTPGLERMFAPTNETQNWS